MSTLSAESKSMLEELADFLAQLPEDRFNYSHWVDWDWGGAPDLSCGTTACAAGWATTLSSFQAKGLHLYRWESGRVDPVVIVDMRELSEEYAMAHVLDISVEDALLLFVPYYDHLELGMTAPGGDASASEVAEHIRRYIEARS